MQFAFEPELPAASWRADHGQPGRYVIEETQTTDVVSDQYSFAADEVEVSWQGFGGDPQNGAQECDPAGRSEATPVPMMPLLLF